MPRSHSSSFSSSPGAAEEKLQLQSLSWPLAGTGVCRASTEGALSPEPSFHGTPSLQEQWHSLGLEGWVSLTPSLPVQGAPMSPCPVPGAGCGISAMGTPMGAPVGWGRLSVVTQGWHGHWPVSFWEGQTTGMHRGCSPCGTLQQQPEPRLGCSRRLCLLCPLPALSLLSWANRRGPARLLPGSRSPTVCWKQRGAFSSSHGLCVPHVPWLCRQERCQGVSRGFRAVSPLPPLRGHRDRSAVVCCHRELVAALAAQQSSPEGA